jgi:acid phosphatase
VKENKYEARNPVRRRRISLALLATTVLGASFIQLTSATATGGESTESALRLNDFKHVVVIYEENHSFDNLYGHWGSINGQKVNGLSTANAANTVQVNQSGTAYNCFLQNDLNLASPSPLNGSCTDSTGTTFVSAFTNAPFRITDYVAGSDATCPASGVYAPNGLLKGSGSAGGCTRDLVHRFYQEQYQIDHGKMDHYVTGSDGAGLVMGQYDTQQLPIYKYLTALGSPNYVLADNFFQASFGGSFLNHQWLIAAQTPKWEGGAVRDGSATDLHSIVDPNGFPNKSYPLYTAPAYVKDSALTEWCTVPQAATDAGVPATLPQGTACGDYAINTIQPTYQPYAPGTPDAKKLPPLHLSNIGDELSAKNVDWAWYSGGWDNANGNTTGPGWTNGTTAGVCSDSSTNSKAVYPNCPSANFQFHHQTFNYYANYAPGTAARVAHLLDEKNFIASATAGTLKAVSFVKPIGDDNEHPGYASESRGSQHLVDLVKAITNGPNGKDTLIVVTYDEFGGAWDHVAPPTASGVSDAWGPGTRIPTLVISPALTTSAVDHTQYDTTSILKTIEKRFDLAPLSSRDAAVAALTSAIVAGSVTLETCATTNQSSTKSVEAAVRSAINAYGMASKYKSIVIISNREYVIDVSSQRVGDHQCLNEDGTKSSYTGRVPSDSKRAVAIQVKFKSSSSAQETGIFTLALEGKVWKVVGKA